MHTATAIEITSLLPSGASGRAEAAVRPHDRVFTLRAHDVDKWMSGVFDPVLRFWQSGHMTVVRWATTSVLNLLPQTEHVWPARP